MRITCTNLQNSAGWRVCKSLACGSVKGSMGVTLPRGRGSVTSSEPRPSVSGLRGLLQLGTSLLLISGLLSAETSKLPEPYQSIVELSRSVPPEFAADALLRVVESGKIVDAAAKRGLVEQAFRQAAMVKFPVRMRGIAGSLVDTRSGYLSRAYDLKLDSLSLQS